MIKIQCPECAGDNIHYIDDDRFDDWFKCENEVCGHEFTFQDSIWVEEW